MANTVVECAKTAPRYLMSHGTTRHLKITSENFVEFRGIRLCGGGVYFTDKLPPSKCWIVWDKICQTPNKSVFADCELAWTNFTKVCKMFKLRQMGFIHDTKDAKRIHPTQKPTELYRWIFENYAKEGDKILDTHLGSGSSRIAAYDAGLDFVGYEIDKEYFDKQEERFEQHTSQQNLLLMDMEQTTL